jgi:hypothetical protein
MDIANDFAETPERKKKGMEMQRTYAKCCDEYNVPSKSW